MIELNIPGKGILQIEHLVCDINGTLALDGQLLEGIARQLNYLRDRVQVHLLTADTHGRQTIIDQQLGFTAQRIQAGDEAGQKAAYLQALGAEQVIAIGQGANDALMLQTAGIGVAVFSREGLSSQALLAADLVVPDIYAALELLEKPLRLVATLRK